MMTHYGAPFASILLLLLLLSTTAQSLYITDPPATLTVADVQVGVDKYTELQGGSVTVSQDIVNEINAAVSTGQSFTIFRQLAFVAQMIWESGAFLYTEELAATVGSMSARDDYQDCEWNKPGLQPPQNGKFFYGRGYLQLSWCANYLEYGRDRANQGVVSNAKYFYNNPEAVAGEYAMDSAVWFFDRFVTMDDDGRFGATTDDINGVVECQADVATSAGNFDSNGDLFVPCKRFQIFEAMAIHMNLFGYSADGCGSIVCDEIPQAIAPSALSSLQPMAAPVGDDNDDPSSSPTTTGWYTLASMVVSLLAILCF